MIKKQIIIKISYFIVYLQTLNNVYIFTYKLFYKFLKKHIDKSIRVRYNVITELRTDKLKEENFMAITISCASIKGGCSKTTSAINLAAALAEKGYRCLVVDFDPQANASMALGIPVEELEFTVANVLLALPPIGKTVPIEDAIYETNFKNLHVVAAHIHLSVANLVLTGATARESILRKELQKTEIQKRYDFIFIDTAPTADILLMNALAASNYVIGCSTCEYLSLTGIDLMLERMHELQDSGINTNIKFLGVIATKYSNTKHSKEIFETLKNRYPLLGCTRVSTKANEATSDGVPVVYNAKNDKVSAEYKRMAEDLIERFESDNL